MEQLIAAVDAVEEERPQTPEPVVDYGRLNEHARHTIVVLSELNWDNVKIGKHVKVHRNTVANVLRRWKETGTIKSGGRSGRPRITDFATDVNIAVSARVERFTTPRKVRAQLNLNISPRTIDRRMIEAGLFGRVARKKRKFSAAEKRKRLSFAEGYRNWNEDDWKKVIFSDEKCFYAYGSCGQVWVRREKGEEAAYADENCVHKIAHPIKVNVWACFAANGVGYMHIFNETLDKLLLKKILKDNLAASAAMLFPSADGVAPSQWWLLHDNDRKFTSKHVSEFLHNTGVKKMEFPPYSPDLNPIENLWAECQKRVSEMNATTLESLQDAIADVWDAVDEQLLHKLATSMPRRCQYVIDAEGGNTKY